MMKAAVIDVDRVTVESIPDPTPGPREVVVAVAACGICGTDLHIADGEFAPTLPVTPGHEFAGEVVAVGTAVDAAWTGCAWATRWPSTRPSTAASATSAGAAGATCASGGRPSA